MEIETFDFILPSTLIAQKKATHSRLLVYNRATESMEITEFNDIKSILHQDDCLILNDTRVIPSRLYATKATGGKVEVFVEKILNDHEAIVLTQSNHRLTLPITLNLCAGGTIEVTESISGLQKKAVFNLDQPLDQYLMQHGATPLPHYIKPDERRIQDEYQTCYAKVDGSIAAPTAGLHFTPQLLTELPCPIDYVTLHVGLGTFLPVKTQHIEDHVMHAESYSLKSKTVDLIKHTQEKKARVLAVGTTSIRTLEDAWQHQPMHGQRSTDIFIYPGYQWQVVDGFITNFHLPKSTLFMLVCAAIGQEAAHACYAYAIQHKMRFYSYGDAMLVI